MTQIRVTRPTVHFPRTFRVIAVYFFLVETIFNYSTPTFPSTIPPSPVSLLYPPFTVLSLSLSLCNSLTHSRLLFRSLPLRSSSMQPLACSFSRASTDVSQSRTNGTIIVHRKLSERLDSRGTVGEKRRGNVGGAGNGNVSFREKPRRGDSLN